MEKRYHHRKFSLEEIERLRDNPFTSKVDYYHIWFTLEFQNIFLSRYEAGETSHEIFTDLGYDPDILGENRIYGFYRRLKKRLKNGQGLTETPGNTRVEPPSNVDYNTLPAQQSVASMQRELKYLRQQVEFLKKISELADGRK